MLIRDRNVLILTEVEMSYAIYGLKLMNICG